MGAGAASEHPEQSGKPGAGGFQPAAFCHAAALDVSPVRPPTVRHSDGLPRAPALRTGSVLLSTLAQLFCWSRGEGLPTRHTKTQNRRTSLPGATRFLGRQSARVPLSSRSQAGRQVSQSNRDLAQPDSGPVPSAQARKEGPDSFRSRPASLAFLGAGLA